VPRNLGRLNRTATLQRKWLRDLESLGSNERSSGNARRRGCAALCTITACVRQRTYVRPQTI
jgi:hypothetical protein